MTMAKKLVRSFIFSVLFALVPLISAWIKSPTHGYPINLQILLEQGELLLIAVCLSGAAVGELIGNASRTPVLEMIAGGACIIVLVFAALYFADVAATHMANEEIDAGIVKNTSLVVYLCAIVCSGSCVAISEVR